MAAPVTELFDVLIAFPLLVYLSVTFTSGRVAFFELIGNASYPLYMISVPIITLASRALHYLNVDDSQPSPLFGSALLAAMIVLALVLAYWDNRFRGRALKYLKCKFRYGIFDRPNTKA
jgi:peptidoglycan/LPS O-acetylase OafA/YrhL